jgi:hypothetical protein
MNAENNIETCHFLTKLMIYGNLHPTLYLISMHVQFSTANSNGLKMRHFFAQFFSGYKVLFPKLFLNPGV